MNAVSPVEEREVKSFGMFDEEDFARIVASSDESVPCSKDACELAAEWRVTLRCCGTLFLMCGPHQAQHVERATFVLDVSPSPRCKICRCEFGPGRSYFDIFSVVPL